MYILRIKIIHENLILLFLTYLKKKKITLLFIRNFYHHGGFNVKVGNEKESEIVGKYGIGSHNGCTENV